MAGARRPRALIHPLLAARCPGAPCARARGRRRRVPRALHAGDASMLSVCSSRHGSKVMPLVARCMRARRARIQRGAGPPTHNASTIHPPRAAPRAPSARRATPRGAALPRPSRQVHQDKLRRGTLCPRTIARPTRNPPGKPVSATGPRTRVRTLAPRPLPADAFRDHDRCRPPKLDSQLRAPSPRTTPHQTHQRLQRRPRPPRRGPGWPCRSRPPPRTRRRSPGRPCSSG